MFLPVSRFQTYPARILVLLLALLFSCFGVAVSYLRLGPKYNKRWHTHTFICKIHLIPLYLGKPESKRAERAWDLRGSAVSRTESIHLFFFFFVHLFQVEPALIQLCHPILHPFPPDSLDDVPDRDYHHSTEKAKQHLPTATEAFWKYIRAVNITRHFLFNCFSMNDKSAVWFGGRKRRM